MQIGQLIYKKIQELKAKAALMDGMILLFTVLLIVISLVMVYSSTMYLTEGGASYPTPFAYVTRQAGAVVLGCGLALIAFLLPTKWFNDERFIFGINAAVIVLLLAVKLFGYEGGGAKSWLRVGPLSLQPGEFAKLSLLFLMAYVIRRSEREYLMTQEPQGWWLKLFSRYGWVIMMIGVILTFILNQPDFGMFMILVTTCAAVLILNIADKKWYMRAAGLIGGLYVILQVGARVLSQWLVSRSNYQLQRIGSFPNPFRYAEGAGYQLVHAYLAMSRGGLFGLGIGRSLAKQNALPAGHTDYILAIIGEELGLAGIVAILFLLTGIVVLTLRWASQSTDSFRKAMFTGIAVLLLIQTTVNVGGITGLLPLTGVTLPFVSYGGTSMMVNVCAIGILQVFIIMEKQAQQQAHQAKQSVIDQAWGNGLKEEEDGIYRR